MRRVPRGRVEVIEGERSSQKPKSRAARSVLVAFICAAVIALIAGLSVLYLYSLQAMIDDESASYLGEIADQVTTSTENTIDGKLNLLESTAATLDAFEDEPAQKLDGALAVYAESLGFDLLACVDLDGTWYLDGVPNRFTGLNVLVSQAVEDGRAFVPEVQNVDGRDYVLFLAPVADVAVEGRTICALVGFMSLENAADTLVPRMFEGKGFADIVTTEGSVVVRSNAAGSLAQGYNLFSTLDEAHFSDGTTVEGLKEHIAAGVAGICRYAVDGTEYVSYYSGMSEHGWVLFCTVPAADLDAKPEAFIRVTLIACLAVAAVIIALGGMVALGQRRSHDRLQRMLYVDRVTGGATRDKFTVDVEAIRSRADGPFALVYANIERFKTVNDLLGTEVADELLRCVHKAFTSSLAEDETVGRLAADHFALFIKAANDEEVRRRVCAWSEEIAGMCRDLPGKCTPILSYGAVIVNDPSTPTETLIGYANLARKSGRARFHNPHLSFYDGALREAMLRDQQLEERMEDALANDEFKAYLQAQYSTDGQLIGFEALARWVLPDGTVMPPSEFIPLFERDGFIVQVDLHIFELVCRMQQERLAAGQRVLPISVNVSRTHLVADDPLASYRQVWSKFDLPYECVVFEFTESIMYDDPDRLEQVLDELRSKGFACSMDDFGSGYSSLGMLNRMDVDTVKIDRSFLGAGPLPSERGARIIEGVVDLAKDLGLCTIAEGVEHKEQVDFLRQCGCDAIQGFYFARPMPSDEALALLDEEDGE